MSSKRAIRRRACNGKVRHASAQDAHAAMKHLHRDKGDQGAMNAYHCQFCGGYHIGHRPGVKR